MRRSAETLSTTAYIENRLLNIAIQYIFLEEILPGKHVSYSHVLSFGCFAYAYTKNDMLDAIELENAYFLVMEMVLRVINYDVLTSPGWLDMLHLMNLLF